MIFDDIDLKTTSDNTLNIHVLYLDTVLEVVYYVRDARLSSAGTSEEAEVKLFEAKNFDSLCIINI